MVSGSWVEIPIEVRSSKERQGCGLAADSELHKAMRSHANATTVPETCGL